VIILDKDLIEKYKNEMRQMYQSVNPPIRAVAAEPPAPMPQSETTPQKSQNPATVPPIQNPTTTTPKTENTTTGGLLGIITAVRSLYPVKNAKVTIFKGNYDNMEIIDTDIANESGRTKIFTLPTPEKSLSLEEDNQTIPYATYNMLVESDGYIKNIHLNIPVFSGVTSLQQSNLILEETAGEDKKPQIFDESQNYDL
jgi:hypothetical protein